MTLAIHTPSSGSLAIGADTAAVSPITTLCFVFKVIFSKEGDDKAFWLKMARDWERLAQLADARRKQG
jgi:hypothetical protein